jgi:hypothetical protein
MSTAAVLAHSYVKPKRIHLKSREQFNERWIQDRIADDPSILGLGALSLVKKELQQPKADIDSRDLAKL